jgi:hypothetical protein
VLEVLVAFPFARFLGREVASAVFREQLLDAVLEVCGGPQAEDFLRRWQPSQCLEYVGEAV